ncbi:Bug family tripartite tricarboxylate transporter substrate binding protein [Roseomonas marmotae]|uniref:Tripartite tricarboxylate transporter substrate binding protein n=1 Tax=Roseomonas marmotae TaxID=2768161 RepID=A0ABS3KAP1_9PROT|nr:tripartite tricarboxylate transporter substrate binding protein [Roseomonas marmotae]MBO1074536.1 tripartite tricarboxylate transporter substrate binding protein [Roseomonas marmotae]
MTMVGFRPPSRRQVLFAAGLLPLGLAGPARAAWPDRPLRLIVAYPPGGTGDLVGRLVAEGLGARIGGTVVVENQAGAGGVIAARAVSRAAPDGYTLLLAGNAIFAIQPHLTDVGFDPLKGFSPIANVSESQRVLAVRNNLPATTLAELVAFGKQNPGKLNFGSAGIGSSLHVMTEMFLREAGVQAVHVPFRGSAPGVQALLSGDIDFMIDTAVIQYVLQGKLRALASVADRRLPQLPELPTLAEQGYPKVRTSGWQAVLGPPGMPAELIDTLAGHIEAMQKDPTFLAGLERLNAVPSFRGPAQFNTDLAEDYRQFGEIIRGTGIRAE